MYWALVPVAAIGLVSWMSGLGGADCASCRPGKLCVPHVEAETSTLKEVRSQLKGKEAAQRIAALDRAAALTVEHMNAPSRDVAKVLCGALEDDSLDVRQKAAELLAEGQDPAESLKGLLRAAGDVQKLLINSGKGLRPAQGATSRSGDGDAYAIAVFDSLAHFRDDRSVEALADLVRKLPHSLRFSLPESRAVKALLDLGARDGFEVAIEIVRQYEGYAGTGQMYHEYLVDAAKARGLEDAPSWMGTGTAAAWMKWLEKHPKEVPAKLGKLAAT